MNKRRLLAAVALLIVLTACGSEDNGGVIEGPTQAPTSVAPRPTGTGPGYSYE